MHPLPIDVDVLILPFFCDAFLLFYLFIEILSKKRVLKMKEFWSFFVKAIALIKIFILFCNFSALFRCLWMNVLQLIDKQLPVKSQLSFQYCTNFHSRLCSFLFGEVKKASKKHISAIFHRQKELIIALALHDGSFWSDEKCRTIKTWKEMMLETIPFFFR